MKLTEGNCFAHDVGLLIKCDNWEEIEKQILDDYEKARKWDELGKSCSICKMIQKAKQEGKLQEGCYHHQCNKETHDKFLEILDNYPQNQKLRELFENFFNGDNVMVKKEYKKILEESKK